jgi:flagellin
MRINNNIMAMNAHRQLGVNQANSSKSMERLSSGMRINRAGDDAAGLAISEKMRGQIRGLKQAQRNAQDGISLIQTAEGALNEIHAILQRMRELAVQSSTDTNTPEDRLEIQKEIDQLATEITRISTDTEFNTQNLLGGEFKAKFHIGANKGQNVDLAINAMDADALKVQGEVYTAESGIAGLQFLNRTGEGFDFEVVLNTEYGKGTFAEIDEASGKITVTLNTKEGEGGESNAASDATLADVKAALESVAGEAGFQLVVADDFNGEAEAETVDGTTLTFEIDEDASKSVGINVSSQTAADAAITTINDALETVSAERSKLGAMQNRLEHTIANLGTSAENLQAAESRIRDLDMAEEIMAFTKNNILQQAATAMLAQANMAPQSVLQLLG